MAFDDSASRVQRVVSVNTSDIGGGAERIAAVLFQGFKQRGLHSWLVVGDRKSEDDGVVEFHTSPNIDYRRYNRWTFQARLKLKKWTDARLGREDYNFPYSHYLTSIAGCTPDLVHCHNLHGGYFDLRVLPRLSQRLPVFLTLHDCWSFTGHCAYPVGCPRWKTGCGHCPHLANPPAITRDATRINWLRKRRLYERSRFFVAAPSLWILRRAQQSVLAAAIEEARVIPNGVDLRIFKPASRPRIRQQLGLPSEAFVAVFVANMGKSSPYKDFDAIRNAIRILGGKSRQKKIFFLVIGGKAEPDEVLDNIVFRHVSFCPPSVLAGFYQAADIYLHAAKEEVFGLVLAEAMGCGTPVVSTNVGGIPEVVVHEEHGLLVPPGDPWALAQSVERLIENPAFHERLCRNACQRARIHFDQEQMIDRYIEWYHDVLERRRRQAAKKPRRESLNAVLPTGIPSPF